MQHSNTAPEETVFDEDGFDEWTAQQQQDDASTVPTLLGTYPIRKEK